MYNPAEEIVQIVDRSNAPIDALPRWVMRQKGLIHRACYILVFNGEGELYLQKRTTTKDIYPGYWDVAAGGVVLAGESYEQSARRELEEELGIDKTPLTFLFDHYFEDADNRIWGRIFSCTNEGPFTLQPEEVAYGQFVSLESIELLNRTEPVTPDGLQLLRLLPALKPSLRASFWPDQTTI